MLLDIHLIWRLGHHALFLLPVVFVAYWILWITYARTLHPLAGIPGPWLASVSRVWIVLNTRRGHMDEIQRALHAQHGPLIRIAPNEIACSDPGAIKLIYRTQAPLTKTDFYPPWRNTSMSKYPDNFSGTDERLHSERRRIVNNVYTLSNVLLSEEYIDKCSKLFVEKMREYADKQAEVDLGEWLQWYAFDVIGELYFGRMFGFMKFSRDQDNYIQSLDTLIPTIVTSAVSPTYIRPFILGSAIISSEARRALKAFDHIGNAARKCVAERMKTAADPQEQSRRDLMHQLLEIVHSKGEKLDFGVHEVEFEAYVGLFAGSDTTAIAMRAVFYFLMTHPVEYSMVQAEIDQAAKAGDLSFPVKYAEALKLPYLCASIKEAMRLHPSVGLTMPRISPAEGLNLCGRYIPKGYYVGMNAAVVQRDRRIFGSDVDEFRPSRWIEGNSKNLDKYMLHFGAGTRTCIGKNISISEIHKLIPTILREFDLELAHPGRHWKTEDLWFNKQKGIHVKLRRRLKP